MSRPSSYNSVHWSREDMIHELEVILGSVMFSYNGSNSRELRETYDRQASILTAVLGSIKSDMSNVWEVRAKAHQQASDAKDATITTLRASLALLGAECNKARRLIEVDGRPRPYNHVRAVAYANTRAATDSSPTAAAAVKGST